jgi:hypothetical protein
LDFGYSQSLGEEIEYIGEKRAVAPPPVRGSFVRDEAQEYCFAITGLFPIKPQLRTALVEFD